MLLPVIGCTQLSERLGQEHTVHHRKSIRRFIRQGAAARVRNPGGEQRSGAFCSELPSAVSGSWSKTNLRQVSVACKVEDTQDFCSASADTKTSKEWSLFRHGFVVLGDAQPPQDGPGRGGRWRGFVILLCFHPGSDEANGHQLRSGAHLVRPLHVLFPACAWHGHASGCGVCVAAAVASLGAERCLWRRRGGRRGGGQRRVVRRKRSWLLHNLYWPLFSWFLAEGAGCWLEFFWLGTAIATVLVFAAVAGWDGFRVKVVLRGVQLLHDAQKRLRRFGDDVASGGVGVGVGGVATDVAADLIHQVFAVVVITVEHAVERRHVAVRLVYCCSCSWCAVTLAARLARGSHYCCRSDTTRMLCENINKKVNVQVRSAAKKSAIEISGKLAVNVFRIFGGVVMAMENRQAVGRISWKANWVLKSPRLLFDTVCSLCGSVWDWLRTVVRTGSLYTSDRAAGPGADTTTSSP